MTDMFGKPQIDLTQIRATSKLSLKMSCLTACGNDVDKAEKLYKFIAENLSSLPDVDPAKASVVEQIKTGANDLFGWIGEHKGDIIEGWNFFQMIRGGAPLPSISTPPVDIPPIPDNK